MSFDWQNNHDISSCQWDCKWPSFQGKDHWQWPLLKISSSLYKPWKYVYIIQEKKWFSDPYSWQFSSPKLGHGTNMKRWSLDANSPRLLFLPLCLFCFGGGQMLNLGWNHHQGASRYDVRIREGHGKVNTVREVAWILDYKSFPNADNGGGGQMIWIFCGCHIWRFPHRLLLLKINKRAMAQLASVLIYF